MENAQRSADIETLARMAARLAGRDPNEYLKITLGEVTAFDDYIWRYPDFLNRAQAAYALLDAPVAPDVDGLVTAAGQGEESEPGTDERRAG